jgi:Asp-tRNA(Asn)/Glu-tRNA(Gln) amidotransferase C subunit
MSEEKKSLWEQCMDGAEALFEPIKRANRLRKDKEKFRSALGNLLEGEVDLQQEYQDQMTNISTDGIDPQTLIDIKRKVRKNKEAQEDTRLLYEELFGKTLKLEVD